MDEKTLQIVAAILTAGFAVDKNFDRVERLCDAYLETMKQLRYMEQQKAIPVPRGRRARAARR